MYEVCVPDVVRENHRDTLEKLWTEWINPKKNIYKIHGESETSRKTFEEWGETILEKPIHKDFILNEGDYARLQLEMNDYNRKISGKFLNGFEDAFFVPEGISLKDPIARAFYKSLNAATNYERVNLSRGNGLQKQMTKFLKDAYVQNGLQGKLSFGIKHFEKIKELSDKLEVSDNAQLRDQHDKLLAQAIDADGVTKEGAILRQFKELMQLDNETFNSKTLTQKDNAGKFTDKPYDANVYNAALNGRAMLKEMGEVTINGLDYFKTAVQWRFLGTNDPGVLKTNSRYRAIEDAIDAAKARIKSGIEKGGYLPSYVMSDMIKAKEAMNDYMNAKEALPQTARLEKLSVLEGVINKISADSMPDHAKAAHPKIHQKYNENPIFIMQQYATDAVAFNKISFMQSKYLETMKKLHTAQDSNWVKGMRKWIDEEFQIASQGLLDRPAWVNEMVRGLMGVQVVRTMGLNLTGAVVNATGMQFGAAHLGAKAIKDAGFGYLNGVTADGKTIRSVVDRVEKQAGFLFNDVSAELIAEGLLPAGGVKTKTAWNHEKGRFEIDGSDALGKLKAAGDWTIEKSLIFHRMTENWSRKWLFRTAFINKLNQYSSQETFVKNMEYAGATGYKAAEKKASAWALEFVNRYAFEYAIHAKPKVARGVPAHDTVGNKVITSKLVAGAAGQATFQLLHYPMSLMQQQSRNIRGGIKALQSGQYDAPELRYLGRYFGLFAALQLGSIVTNLNLNGIMPNETLEMITDIEDSFTQPLDPQSTKKTFGLVSEFTGPTVGWMKWGLLYSGIMNTDSSYLSQVLLGNVDYAGEDEKYNSYQLSTLYGQWSTKIGPSLEDGRGWDALRHYFRMYPGELPYPGFDITTKEARKAVGKATGIDMLKGKPKKTKDYSNASYEDIMKALSEI